MAAAAEIDTPVLISMPSPRTPDDGEPSKHSAPRLWDDTGGLDLSDLSDPDAGLPGSSIVHAPAAPLTSEPPLADAAPLTSEQPLATELPLTSEPTGTGLYSDARGADEACW